MSCLVRITPTSLLSTLETNLLDTLSTQLFHRHRQVPSPAEKASWARSLPALAKDLHDAGLHDVEMLLEFQLPLTSKRADVILAGKHPGTGQPSYVVVELKQWSAATSFEGNPNLVSIPAYGPHTAVAHPLLQVRGYADYLVDFTCALADLPHAVAAAAYLHNAHAKDVPDLWDLVPPDRTRLFTMDRRSDWLDFLRQKLAPEPGGTAADLLLNSKIAPSRQLLAVAAEEVQSREMFVLLDEQRTAYEHVLHAVDKAHRANQKTAVVISGGPGSGKSVIALSVMGELARQGRTVLHATGSQSFTQSLRKVAGHRKPAVQKLFTYFNSFMDARPNDLDCLIADEAHRIRETSVNRFTKKALREQARPQIDELLAAARVPVFLLDEFQVVRPGEQGTAAGIESQARAQGIDVVRIDLSAQFRCGGSEPYVRWVTDILHLTSGPIQWEGDPAFSVEIADTPEQLEDRLAALRESGYSARMTAGYCWRWSDPADDGSLVPDVSIGGWARPWNLKSQRAVNGIPSSTFWAMDDAGASQVGCVYTAQGFEFDYVGVIIGPDLVLREDGWRAVRNENRDPAFRSHATVSDADFDALVRNVYKVLLTRGLRGVVIHSTDPETRERLHKAAFSDI